MYEEPFQEEECTICENETTNYCTSLWSVALKPSCGTRWSQFVRQLQSTVENIRHEAVGVCRGDSEQLWLAVNLPRMRTDTFVIFACVTPFVV